MLALFVLMVHSEALLAAENKGVKYSFYYNHLKMLAGF